VVSTFPSSSRIQLPCFESSQHIPTLNQAWSQRSQDEPQILFGLFYAAIMY